MEEPVAAAVAREQAAYLSDSDVDAMPNDPRVLKYVIQDLQFRNSLACTLLEQRESREVAFDKF